VQVAFTKNGEDATLPLPTHLADALCDWVAGRAAADPVFAIPSHGAELLKAFKKDLAHAGIPYRDDLGRYADFHSLRKSLGTALRQAGVDVAVSRRLMRHSDVRLTLQVYNDDRLHDLHEAAVSRLPVIALDGAGGGTATSAG
jgi:integrase